MSILPSFIRERVENDCNMCCAIPVSLENQLKKKAKKSPSKYKISAVAFDKKGEILGKASNTYSKFGIEMSNKYMGVHAERKLMERYGKNIKSIVIMRIGRGGALLPVDPCKMCAGIAEKLGIKIYSLKPGIGGRGFIDRPGDEE